MIRRSDNVVYSGKLKYVGILFCLAILSCDALNTLSWWQTSIIYQIYPRSFKDSNGDGVGDIPGITANLDHFVNIGVDSIWLSPVYRSPMFDFGYDISNFTDIDPIFGTLADFDVLVAEAHKKGIHIIMDFVPGHTSTQHDWFIRSENNETHYRDYYVWADGTMLANGTRVPPNNWLSVFGGTSWTWSEKRKQYYYHAFLPQQGDLNYRNPQVHLEMINVLKFWLDRNVDGFRVDAIEKLYEAKNVSQDEPPSGLNVPTFQNDYLSHIYTSNQPENMEAVAEWVKVLSWYRIEDGIDRYMVVELYGEPALRNQLYTAGANPFNFDFVEMTNVTGFLIRDYVDKELSTIPPGTWPNFVLGNHDRRRVSHRYGPERCDVYNMLLLTLPGTPTTYYGEEIGMLEPAFISFNDTIDPWGKNFGPDLYQQFSRDPERTPLPWTGGYQGGFTTGNKTWLPLGQNYTTINIDSEQKQNRSSIQLYTQLAELRKMDVFQNGTFKTAYVDINVYSFSRQLGDVKFLIAINIGNFSATVDFSSYGNGNRTGIVVAVTPAMLSVTKGQALDLGSVSLGIGDGVILSIKADPTVNANTTTTVTPDATTKSKAASGLRPDILTFYITCVFSLLQIFVHSILRCM